jgi:hypothetical protein
LSGVLIAVLYGYALDLPFYFDDLPVLEWLEGRGLAEVWTRSNENAYYRPLTFSVYKLALALPKGMQQKVLHGINLVLHWAAAVMVGRLAGQTADDGRGQSSIGTRMNVRGTCAAVLYAVFPFFFRAVPWVTAMPHFLVIALCLVAALAALRAEERGQAGGWIVSLVATALAPFAHESGLVCGAIVGGLVLLRPRTGRRWKRLAWAAGGVALNVGALAVRSALPGTGAFSPVGLDSALENALYGLHGLVYPLGTAIGGLVRRGGHDLALVGAAAALCTLLWAGLAWRTRAWRWIARALWWWGCASLPSLLAFRYGALVNSPRFYALPAVGIVMVWAGAIARLVETKGVRRSVGSKPLGYGRRATSIGIALVLTAAIALPGGVFLWQQRQVHLDLFDLYQSIIAAAESNPAPLGYVNVPAWLTPKEQTYALTKDGVIGLALYNDVGQLVRVNTGALLGARNVMHVHTLYEPRDAYFGFHGDWLEGAEMRQFAADHWGLYQVRYRERAPGDAGFELQHVGRMEVGAESCAQAPRARFEGGPGLLDADPVDLDGGKTGIALTWRAGAPVQAGIFVHVVDAQGALVAQADGPALGGLLPPPVWQPGDCIYDVRPLDLPSTGGPFTVLAGLYTGQNRLPAYVGGARAPNDAVPVAQIER